MAISGSAALLAASIASAAISAGAGVYGAVQSANAQQKSLNAQAAQAEYNAKINEKNKALAEEEAGANRKAAYENMNAKRLDTARLIGRQRATQGANGAALDEGSNLDAISETAASGEIDAINTFNQGIDQSYKNQIEAWNYQNKSMGEYANAGALGGAATEAKNQGYVNAAIAGLSGMASMGSAWGNYKIREEGGKK